MVKTTQSWLKTVIPALRWQPEVHREMDWHRAQAKKGENVTERGKLPTVHVKVDSDGKVVSSGIVNGNHRLVSAFEARGRARVALRIEMGDREVEKVVELPLAGLRPKYVGRAKRMKESITEAMTRHDKKGRFCNLDSARTVVKDGVRHLVVGKYDRKTGQVKRHPRKRPKSKTEQTLDLVQRGRDRVAGLVDTRRMAVPLGDLVVEGEKREVKVTDEMILDAAKRVVAKDFIKKKLPKG